MQDEHTHDTPEPDRQAGAILGRTLDVVLSKLQAANGLSDQDVGRALLSTSINVLGRVLAPAELVALLSGTAEAIADTYQLDPETGEAAPRTRN